MPYILIQFIAFVLWFTVPSLAGVPLWVVLIPLDIVIVRLAVLLGLAAWAAAN